MNEKVLKKVQKGNCVYESYRLRGTIQQGLMWLNWANIVFREVFTSD